MDLGLPVGIDAVDPRLSARHATPHAAGLRDVGALNYQPIAAHALLWKDGSPIDLGNLGGTDNNVPFAINNRGQVVGYANVSGDSTSHAFLWQKRAMSDLGTLPGDDFSVAEGMNDESQVVGVSCGPSNNCRAFVWQNGSMTDLKSADYASFAAVPDSRGGYQ